MRDCGTCGLCCKLITIKSLQKEEGQWCEFWEKDKGCKQQNIKPEECRNFSCLWVNEMIPEELSPRRTGIIAWATQDHRIMLSQNRHFHNLEAFKGAILQWARNGVDVGIVQPK